MSGSVVSTGVTSSNISVTNGEDWSIYGTALRFTVSYGGVVEVFFGGTTISTTVSHAGNEYVELGGVASDTTVSNGGAESVSSGGASISTTVDNYGSEEVVYGSGTASFTTVSSGGIEYVYAGTATDTTVSSGGTQVVYNYGTTTGTKVDPGGFQYVDSDGTAVSTTMRSNGTEYVFSGGTTSDTMIGSGGTEIVYSDGSTSFTTVSSGGTLIVLPGGTAISTTVLSGGETISTGVVLYRPSSGFTFLGSSATGISVTSGTVEYVLSGGTAISTTVGVGGAEYVYSGGTTSFTTLSYGGGELVSSGGSTVGTTVSNGGALEVFSDGTASFTTVSRGGYEYVFGGTAISASVRAGGTEFVYSGGTASFTTLSTGGTEIVSSGGTTISTTLDFEGSQNVSGGTASFTTVSRSGNQEVTAGGMAISTAVDSGGDQYVISGGGVASFTTVSSGGIAFAYSSGTMIDTALDNGGYEVVSSGGTAVSTTLGIGGVIDVAYLAFSGGSATLDPSTNLLTVYEGVNSYTQQLAGTYYSTEQVQVASGTYGGTEVTLEGAICFCAGTLIETPAGPVRVQDLAVGDLVMTLRGITQPSVWIGSGAVLATRGRRTAATPVIVRKGALADNVPFHDLRVTKGHALYIDGALVPVEFLVNHRSIEWDDRAQEVKLYHIELETHDVLIANGAPAESYRDDGNRWLFRNADDGWGLPPREPYASVLTGGPVVDAAWRRLLDRAGPRPGLPLTQDADLHLLVDGQRLDAASRRGEVYVFALPRPPRQVRIVSRAAAPAELGLARDPRVLGVALRGIALRQGTTFRLIDPADERLADGFHLFEACNGLRWTDGDATVPAALFQGVAGSMELMLQVGATTRYPLLDPGAARNVV